MCGNRYNKIQKAESLSVEKSPGKHMSYFRNRAIANNLSSKAGKCAFSVFDKQ